MEYWKENVNYRQEKGPEGTRYLITVDGMDVEVEEMERRERYLVEVESDMCVSLEGLAADEDTIPYLPDNPESILIAVETEREQASLLCLLPEALEQLTESEREFIRALYFEGISLREYCRSKGIPVMTQHYRLQQVLKKLKNILS